MSGEMIDDIDLVPVSADGEELPFTEDDLNYVRSRTFNPELTGLLNKVIFDRQDAPDTVDVKIADDQEFTEDISPLSVPREEIVSRLHALFYKTINLAELEGVTAGFNPFTIQNQDLYNYSVEYIRNECARINIQEFTLLFFNPLKKAYISKVYEMKSFDINNIIFSPEEQIYRDILRSDKGILLDYDTIQRNPYLKKRFSRELPFKGAFYCVLIQNLVMDIWKENCSPLEKELVPGNLFPLFVAVIEDPAVSADFIFQTLQKKIAFSLYIINNYISNTLLPEEFRTPAFLCSLIDTYGRMYSGHPDTESLLVTYPGVFNNQSYIMMNYLDNKLFHLIGPNSSVLHFEKHKIILFIAPEDRIAIRSFLDGFLRYFGDSFSVRDIHRSSQMNLFEMLT